MSTEPIFNAVMRMADRHHQRRPFKTHLDVGAGTGTLLEKIRTRYGTQSSACDYTTELMKLPGQKVDVVNLNSERFPYPDATFDFVTATEVVEHLERYREVLRDMFRILKPGGVCILSTPNILNLNSRLRFFYFGFWNLFGPLPVKHSALYSTGGHINPCSYFYLAHSLMDAGFDDVSVEVDKHQRSAIPKLIFCYLPIRIFGGLAYGREQGRFKTIDEGNAPLVQAMNSTDLLLGRTIIVAARKPGG